jgi:hypothetical protein
VDEIAAQDFSLSIPLYVRGQGESKAKGETSANRLREVVRIWEKSSERLDATVDSLLEALEERR